jgi:hypothetical protein
MFFGCETCRAIGAIHAGLLLHGLAGQQSIKPKRMPMMNYKALVAASLMSIALPSYAFAQCADCALYPDRDPLTKEQTPAGKMGLVQPGGAAAPPNAAASANTANTANNPNNARAEMRAPSQRTGGLGGNRAKKEVRSPEGRSR